MNRMSDPFWKSQYLPLWASVVSALFTCVCFLEWKCFDFPHDSIDILNTVCLIIASIPKEDATNNGRIQAQHLSWTPSDFSSL